MTDDPYKDLAEHYDRMKFSSPNQNEFFRTLFEKHQVKNVLDCACGTGHELILFNSFGCEVHGSDLSDSMLEQAQKNLAEANLQYSHNGNAWISGAYNSRSSEVMPFINFSVLLIIVPNHAP